MVLSNASDVLSPKYPGCQAMVGRRPSRASRRGRQFIGTISSVLSSGHRNQFDRILTLLGFANRLVSRLLCSDPIFFDGIVCGLPRFHRKTLGCLEYK